MDAFIYIVCSVIVGLSFMALGAIIGMAYAIESEKKTKRPILKAVPPPEGEA